MKIPVRSRPALIKSIYWDRLVLDSQLDNAIKKYKFLTLFSSHKLLTCIQRNTIFPAYHGLWLKQEYVKCECILQQSWPLFVTSQQSSKNEFNNTLRTCGKQYVNSGCIHTFGCEIS